MKKMLAKIDLNIKNMLSRVIVKYNSMQHCIVDVDTCCLKASFVSFDHFHVFLFWSLLNILLSNLNV